MSSRVSTNTLLLVAVLFYLPFTSTGQEAGSTLNRLHNDVAMSANNDTLKMLAYKGLGSYYALEDRDSSGYYLEKALPIAVRLGLKLEEASILIRLGILQMQQEKYSRSMEYYLKAMHIAKDPSTEKTVVGPIQKQDPYAARMLQISVSYDMIGLLNAYTGNWTVNINNQLKNYREAEKYAALSKSKGQMASVVFHKGIAHMSADRIDSALLLLDSARSMFSKLNDPQLGRAFIYTAETYLKGGRPDLAAGAATQAVTLLNKTNDNVHRGLAYLTLSKAYHALHKTDSALYAARQSFIIYEKRNDPAWKRDASNLLASYFGSMGRADSATYYLKLAKALTDSLSTEERKNLLAFQDVLIEEQAKLEQLEKERIESREKLKTTGLLSGILVAAAIAVLLYRNNRSRKRANELLQQRNEKIEQTLEQLRSTQAQLIQSEKMASLGELTAGIAHEIQNPLNFVNNFSETGSEMLEEMKEKIRQGDYREADLIAEDIRLNLEKISHHGKRADEIVKGMLQHSRKHSGEKAFVNLNKICEENLRLAYLGFQAKHKDANIKLESDLDPAIPAITVVPQDMGRVILNLLNNAFYAIREKAVRAGNADVEQRVSISTQKFGNSLLIKISDNGIGIPEPIKDKIFQPFFTTKPTGQGTGLGLSLAFDIVKAHGGELSVETQAGVGSTFTVKLPLDI